MPLLFDLAGILGGEFVELGTGQTVLLLVTDGTPVQTVVYAYFLEIFQAFPFREG